MTNAITANRINHADTAFDADHAAVTGGAARKATVGSYQGDEPELDYEACHEFHREFETECPVCWFERKGSRAQKAIGADLEEKIAHEAWTAQA